MSLLFSRFRRKPGKGTAGSRHSSAFSDPACLYNKFWNGVTTPVCYRDNLETPDNSKLWTSLQLAVG
jgi:hypothetical protein